MKNKIKVIILVVFFAALFLGILIWEKHGTHKGGQSSDSGNGVIVTEKTSKERSAEFDKVETDGAKEGATGSTGGAQSEQVRPDWMDKKTWEFFQTMKKIGEQSNVPINFYGQVIDQEGFGIENVLVTVELAAYDETWAENLKKTKSYMKFSPIEVYTDSNGFFAVEKESGETLRVISLIKGGYYSRPYYKTFNYSRVNPGAEIYSPNKENPIVFEMWKKYSQQTPATLKKHKFRIETLTDGAPIKIDLVKKIKVRFDSSYHDMAISISKKESENKKYNWSYKIEINNGGIVQTQDDYMFRAPDSGYQEVFEENFDASQEDWSRSIRNKKFYFQARNGQIHAALLVTLFPTSKGKGLIYLDYVINSNGSQNLELF